MLCSVCVLWFLVVVCVVCGMCVCVCMCDVCFVLCVCFGCGVCGVWRVMDTLTVTLTIAVTSGTLHWGAHIHTYAYVCAGVASWLWEN